MKFIKILFPILAAALVSACQTAHVVADFNDQARLKSYKTFSMYDVKTKEAADQPNRDRISRSIKAEMLKKGYTEDNSNPHLLVNALTVVKKKSAVQVTGTAYGDGEFYIPYGYGRASKSGYATTQTYDYNDGLLIIDVVDARTRKMIWHGTAQAELEKRPEQAFKSAVERLMKSFPATD